MRWTCFAMAALLLAGCGAASGPGVTKTASDVDALTLPAPRTPFAPVAGLAVQRPNPEIAQDFLDLEFHLESGQALPLLTRFEGPVTLAMTGAVPPSARGDLVALIARLRAEAGLDLTLLPDGSPAMLTLDFERRAVLRGLDPTAACFVVPNVGSLAEYRRWRGAADLNWATLRQRRRATLFLPSDTSPQEIRDCLHEETAQALGPVNDLYRLPDSVFNDDNFQSVLTGFDMLMLRLHYAPELASGMSQAEVAALLPGLLARLNPQGDGGAQWALAATPRIWLDQVSLAANGSAPVGLRQAAAERALAVALDQGWQDNRLGFAYYIRARLEAPKDAGAPGTAYDAAEADYAASARIYETLPDGGVHLAHALMQLAAIALAKGQDDRAIALADQALPLARLAQNAALVATLMLLKAGAFAASGQDAAAEALRLDTLAYARYGFGAEPEMRARAAEIAVLVRQDNPG